MDVFARVIEALAWPVAVLLIFFSLRPELKVVIKRLRRIKHGDSEAEFDRDLARTEEIAATALPSLPPKFDAFPPQVEDTDKFQHIASLARYSARAAVMDAWRELELAAVGAALKSHLPARGPMGRVSGIAAIEQLGESRRIGPEIKELYQALRALRNEATHGEFDMSETDATRYAALALQFASWLRKLDA